MVVDDPTPKPKGNSTSDKNPKYGWSKRAANDASWRRIGKPWRSNPFNS